MKKQAKKAIKKVAAKKKPLPVKAAPKKTAKKAAKKCRAKNEVLAQKYLVNFYNTLLSFSTVVNIGHPPRIGDVLLVKKAPYTEPLRGVVVSLEPLRCLLDPTENKRGDIIL